jgi:amino acid transporter
MDEIIEKAYQYFHTYSIIGRAHYIAWEKAARRNKWLGIPVVITTTIVGTAIFGTLQESPGVAWKITAGLLSLLAAVLSALQTTLKYSELAEKHKTAGAKYAAMRRRLDIFVLKHRGGP